jgi:phosphatidylglycerol:prolipoprotein diacylglycerol transferase
MHPILFTIGDFYIGTYGLFVALGLLAGIFVATRFAKKNGVDENLILDLAFVCVLAGGIGARLTYIIVEWDGFLDAPKDYIFSRTGFVFAGGLITGAVAGVWFLRRREAPVWLVCDVAATGMPLAHALGRIACFFSGCCFGATCDLPWAVTYPKVVDPQGNEMGVHAYHAMDKLISWDAARSLPVHPTQLYEAGALLLIFLAVLWIWRSRKFEGQILLVYLLLYSIARFIIEIYRGDPRGTYSGISTSQWISVAMFVFAIAFYAKRFRIPIPERPAEPVPDAEPGDNAGASQSKKKRRRR